MKKFFTCAFFIVCVFAAAQAQSLSFNYQYKFDRVQADEPPKFNGIPNFDYPDAARKNGVEGTLKASVTLGEDGKVRDIIIIQGLPEGVTQAFTAAVQKMYFEPARLNGKPIAVKMTVDFIVSVLYAEGDKNVTKAKILEQPSPPYPSKFLAEKLKGKVEVQVTFFADGKLKVFGANSTMPKEFDRAALEAAAKIKFQPAVHKKSKNPVSQQMTVVYDFKP